MTLSNAPRCLICPGHGHGLRLGTLGRLRWYRCRDCRMDFNRPFRRTPAQNQQPRKERAHHG